MRMYSDAHTSTWNNTSCPWRSDGPGDRFVSTYVRRWSAYVRRSRTSMRSCVILVVLLPPTTSTNDGLSATVHYADIALLVLMLSDEWQGSCRPVKNVLHEACVFTFQRCCLIRSSSAELDGLNSDEVLAFIFTKSRNQWHLIGTRSYILCSWREAFKILCFAAWRVWVHIVVYTFSWSSSWCNSRLQMQPWYHVCLILLSVSERGSHCQKASTERESYIISIQSLLPPPPQPFYGPFSGTTRVSRCQKRNSGLYGAGGD